MSGARALLLAAAQGLLEFLPVSSSAHLALLHLFLAGPDAPEPLGFIILLHLATSAAAVTHYRREYALALAALWRSGRGGDVGPALRYALALAATGASALPLWLFQSWTASFWSIPAVIGVLMVANGAVLYLAPRRERHPDREVGFRAALWVGLAQGAASLPGLSRSGLTMAVALGLGVGRERAVAFSMTLAPAAILGSALAWLAASPAAGAELRDGPGFAALLPALLLAYLVALAAIDWLARWVQDGRLHWFAPWSVGAGTVAVVGPWI